jgi:hypothetical protein
LSDGRSNTTLLRRAGHFPDLRIDIWNSTAAAIMSVEVVTIITEGPRRRSRAVRVRSYGFSARSGRVVGAAAAGAAAALLRSS